MALSPWPPTTSAVALKAATVLLRAAIGEGKNQTTGPGFAYDATDAAVQRLGATVSAHVERFAADAPQPIKDEAVIRASAWLFDTKGAVRIDGVAALNLSPAPTTSAPWFRHSGAMALLSPFKIRRAGVIGD